MISEKLALQLVASGIAILAGDQLLLRETGLAPIPEMQKGRVRLLTGTRGPSHAGRQQEDRSSLPQEPVHRHTVIDVSSKLGSRDWLEVFITVVAAIFTIGLLVWPR